MRCAAQPSSPVLIGGWLSPGSGGMESRAEFAAADSARGADGSNGFAVPFVPFACAGPAWSFVFSSFVLLGASDPKMPHRAVARYPVDRCLAARVSWHY